MKLILSLAVTAVGIYFAFAGRWFVYRNFPQAFRVFQNRNENRKTGISTFSSLCTNLGATIGTGNILGVAVAIVSGGPGALFWMIVGSLSGMTTKFYENCLAVRYQTKDHCGENLGGPFCYMQMGLGRFGNILALFFATSCLAVGLLGMGTIIQSNSIALSLEQVFIVPFHHENKLLLKIIIAVLITILTALVILGGGKKIADVCSRLVPLMAVAYVFLCVCILSRHYSKIPKILLLVCREAVGWQAVGGGFVGAMLSKAASKGIQMGVFSNEAGLGTGAISAGSSECTNPIEQGFTGAISVFIDTVVLCTLTGLTILVTGAWQAGGDPVDVTTRAWSAGLPMEEMTIKVILALFLSVFSFTSILGWNFFAERSAEFIFQNSRAILVYQALYLLAVFIGPFLSSSFVWTMGETTTWFMLIPNLLSLILLRNRALQITKE